MYAWAASTVIYTKPAIPLGVVWRPSGRLPICRLPILWSPRLGGSLGIFRNPLVITSFQTSYKMGATLQCPSKKGPRAHTRGPHGYWLVPLTRRILITCLITKCRRLATQFRVLLTLLIARGPHPVGKLVDFAEALPRDGPRQSLWSPRKEDHVLETVQSSDAW